MPDFCAGAIMAGVGGAGKGGVGTAAIHGFLCWGLDAVQPAKRGWHVPTRLQTFITRVLMT